MTLHMESTLEDNIPDCSNPIFEYSSQIYEYNADWLNVNINEPAINSEVRQMKYLASTIIGRYKIAWLLKAISFIDLTSLTGHDTSVIIERLCQKTMPTINTYFKWNKSIHTAAVCVYPSRVTDTVNTLRSMEKTDVIKVASVAAGFPSGQYPLQSRLQEVSCAIDYGANEIDIVIDRTLALDHKWKELYSELVAIRKLCDEKGHICLKTILSTGELDNMTNVYKTAMVAMMAGANFIKTSTGTESVNATLPEGIVMCRAIVEFQRLTTRKIGLKPAGGIKTVQDVLEWMTLVKEELGDEWLTNYYFRIGASSLLENLITEIETYEEEEEDDSRMDDERESSVESA